MQDTVWLAKQVAELVDTAWFIGTVEGEDIEDFKERMNHLREKIKKRCGQKVLNAIDRTTEHNGA